MTENKRSTSQNAAPKGPSQWFRAASLGPSSTVTDTVRWGAETQAAAQRIPALGTGQQGQSGSDVERVVVGIRNYESFRHAYLFSDLEKMRTERWRTQVHPLCHRRSLVRGLPHVYELIGRHAFVNLGGPFIACPGCGDWLADNLHAVRVDDRLVVLDKHEDVVAIRGALPRPRLPGARVGSLFVPAPPEQPPAYVRAEADTPERPLPLGRA